MPTKTRLLASIGRGFRRGGVYRKDERGESRRQEGCCEQRGEMASEDSFLVLVHHRGSIKRKTQSGVKFTDKDPLCIIVSPMTSYDGLVMFLSLRQFPEVRTPELLAKFFDVVSSSGGSNRNANTIATAVSSSSRPAVASSSIPVYEAAVQPAASPSFAVDLAGNVGDEVGYEEHHPTEVQCPPPAGVGEGLCDDPDDDEVEPDIITDESGDDVGASDPIMPTGGSSSGTNQYPPHFSSLDLDAMRQDEHLGQLAGFGARDTEGSASMTEFQVGQQFQDKDEALLSVKTYSIRRGVQYKVVESDYRRYVGKCSEFGNGCTWLIRLSL
ncbi:uncharacterized protein LOC107636047 [Arachis ipaensis]|uniref:uncharacterized protein LOC107636047 n=1 Tax=Arachis ipaensis TaxID=130454 RepID=UPI0007AEFB7C|nr:uncharacterized protein LOC107636047 [Arachis ipaensis]